MVKANSASNLRYIFKLMTSMDKKESIDDFFLLLNLTDKVIWSPYDVHFNEATYFLSNIFKQLAYPFNGIDEIKDIEYRNLFKLLYLYEGENKNYALAMSIVKSNYKIYKQAPISEEQLRSHSKVYSLIYDMSATLKYILYLLDFDVDLIYKLQDIFNRWFMFPSILK